MTVLQLIYLLYSTVILSIYILLSIFPFERDMSDRITYCSDGHTRRFNTMEAHYITSVFVKSVVNGSRTESQIVLIRSEAANFLTSASSYNIIASFGNFVDPIGRKPLH